MLKRKLYFLKNISFVTILSLFVSCSNNGKHIEKRIDNISELNDMFRQHRHLLSQIDFSQDLNTLQYNYGEAIGVRKDIFKMIVALMREQKIKSIQIEYYSTSLVECRIEEQERYLDSFIRIANPAMYVRKPVLLAGTVRE